MPLQNHSLSILVHRVAQVVHSSLLSIIRIDNTILIALPGAVTRTNDATNVPGAKPRGNPAPASLTNLRFARFSAGLIGGVERLESVFHF